MRGLIWVIGLAALAVALAVVGRYNEGFVLIQWPPYRIQLTANLFILLLVVGFLVVHWTLRLVARALAMPSAVVAFRARRKSRAAQRAFERALTLLFEGRYGQALRQAESAYAAGHAPALTALIGLRASHGLRDEARAATWHARALEHDAETRSARLLTEAEGAVQGRDFERAAGCIAQLQASGARHVAALRIGLSAAIGRRSWHEALRIIRLLEKHGGLSVEQAGPMKAHAHRGAIAERRGDASALLAYFRAQPAIERDDARFVHAIAEALHAAGDNRNAERLLEAHLDSSWDEELMALYGRIPDGDLPVRIGRAEKWLKQRPQDSGALLALGRLCGYAGLWGKAESYLEAALSLAPSAGAHRELGRLLDRLGRSDEANAHYRAACDEERQNAAR